MGYFCFPKKSDLSPKVSIIIPCYNHGQYLPEVLSNLDPISSDYEVIIVNDGSTQDETLKALNIYRAKGFQVIDQVNQGLSAARNTGILNSKGSFILMLDADNTIEKSYIEHAVRAFEEDSAVAVVYSDAEYFGDKSGRWDVGPFNLQRLMIANYIDACAMIRKTILDELGGYDIEMKGGWEDWEMWLRIALAGKKFHYIPQIGFKYRVYPTQMSGIIRNNYENRNRLTAYLHQKYPAYLGHQHITDFVLIRFKPNPMHFIVKLSMLAWFNKQYQKLLTKNKIIDGI